MNAEHRQQLIQAAENASEQQGNDLYQFCGSLSKLIDKFRPQLEAFQSREAMEAYLASIPPEEEAAVTQMVGVMLAFPTLFQEAVQGQIRTVVESLPAKPTGPPRKLTPELSRAISDYVYELFGKRVPLGVGQARAAQKFKVSLRTAQRAWTEREDLADRPVLSLTDIWKLLQKE